MGRQTGIGGAWAIPASQIETDYQIDAPPGAVAPGAVWDWHGGAVRLDGPVDVLRLGAGAVPHGGPADDADGPEMPDPGGFVLTDGRRTWTARLVDGGRLVVFDDGLPPQGEGLWVVRVGPERLAKAPLETMCFTPEARIATPGGPVPVAALQPGHEVLTRDAGPQEVLWTGSVTHTATELRRRPDLRPVRLLPGALGIDRPDPALTLSPAHRVLLRGPGARALFATDEVLVRAADLVDDARVLRCAGLAGVTYVHILLAQHQVIWANGLACESFRPEGADLTALPGMQRAALLSACARHGTRPDALSDPARRMLDTGEAAILRAGTGCAGV